MKSDRTWFTEQVESGAVYVAATFFIVLGAINVVHNMIPLFQGAAGTWWPVLLGTALFGIGPFLFGTWLVWKPVGPNQTTAGTRSHSAVPRQRG